ncbi:MAG: DsbA family protein [Gammaproteobacteria bacterium]|nr:DsbA family protein [Gammaproteobacteria bacterium]
MKRYISVAVLGMMSAGLFAADADFNDAQKKAIQSVVHDYLVNQPEVLIEASQTLQKKQQVQMQQSVQKSVEMNAKEVFTGAMTTVGNPTGQVTLVEFFDYQCGHCKKMAGTVKGVMDKDSSLRVIYKEFPIFGESSSVAARAALAAGKQHQYLAMHEALLQAPGKLNEAAVMNIASKLHLDVAQLKKDMASKDVQNEIDATRALAEKLHLMGTPAFIIASTPKGVYQAGKPVFFIPGAASEASLLDMIKQANG